MEGAFIILIFGGVIAITAVVFGLWLIATIIRIALKILIGVPRLFLGVPSRSASLQMPAQRVGRACANQKCHATLPADANFCRRCGAEQPAAQRVAVRRVAML